MTVLVIALIAFAATICSAPVIRRLLIRKHVLDVPNHRSSHTTPVPRAGGLACLVGLVTASIVAAAIHASVSWASVVAGLTLCVVGLVDDVRSLPPAPRLLLQVVVGAALGLVAGGPWLCLFAAILFPVVVNVVNFMDGINGISGAVLMVWGAAALVLGSTRGSGALAVLGAVSLGVASGFLPWNVPRARLFLGDSGSYLMGAVIAAGVTVGTAQQISPLVLMSPLALYGGDVALTLVRRTLRGAPLTEAHREHAYQRLVSVAGMSHTSVALTVAVLSALIWVAWFSLPSVASFLVTGTVTGAFLALPALRSRRRTSRMPVAQGVQR